MIRNYNTNKSGFNWTEKQIKEVWEKGEVIYGKPKEKLRLDKCGNEMEFKEHGIVVQIMVGK